MVLFTTGNGIACSPYDSGIKGLNDNEYIQNDQNTIILNVIILCTINYPLLNDDTIINHYLE